MSRESANLGWVGKLALAMTIATTVVLLLRAIVWLYVSSSRQLADWEMMKQSLAAMNLLLPLLLAGWLLVAYGVVLIVAQNLRAVEDSSELLTRIEAHVRSHASRLDRLHETCSLSDETRSFVYRDREVEALREAIRGDLIRRDYDAALALIEQIEKRPGLARDAQKLREDVEQSRQATAEEQVDAAFRQVQEMVNRRDWTAAFREAKRMQAAFPESPKIQNLPRAIETARTRRKRSLLQEYGEAVRRNDVERGVQLLKELDLYLTPDEAAALQESARGVFRAKLHNLGVKFAICVTDENWAEAVATGEEIIREFPNTRMAREVQQKMESLRSKVS
jgi:hypothetical protein